MSGGRRVGHWQRYGSWAEEKVEVGAVVLGLRKRVLERVSIRMSDVRRRCRWRKACGGHGTAGQVGEVGRPV